MAITIVNSSGASSGATVGTAQTVTLPTGWQAGDLVLIVGFNSFNNASVSQTGGTGTFTLRNINQQGAGTSCSYCYYRIMQTGDTNPTFTVATPGTNGQQSYSAIALRPDPGFTIFLDVFGADTSSTGTNTWTPGSATAKQNNELSVILVASSDTSSGAFAMSDTPSSGWSAASGAFAHYDGATGKFSDMTDIATKSPVSGSVAPGSASISASNTTPVIYAFHALVGENPNPSGQIPSTPRRRPASRAVVQNTKGTVLLLNAGKVQPWMTRPPRRYPSRAVTRNISGTPMLLAAGSRQPLMTRHPRRYPSRAYVQTTPKGFVPFLISVPIIGGTGMNWRFPEQYSRAVSAHGPFFPGIPQAPFIPAQNPFVIIMHRRGGRAWPNPPVIPKSSG